jgi:hypothetical protein
MKLFTGEKLDLVKFELLLSSFRGRWLSPNCYLFRWLNMAVSSRLPAGSNRSSWSSRGVAQQILIALVLRFYQILHELSRSWTKGFALLCWCLVITIVKVLTDELRLLCKLVVKLFCSILHANLTFLIFFYLITNVIQVCNVEFLLHILKDPLLTSWGVWWV